MSPTAAKRSGPLLALAALLALIAHPAPVLSLEDPRPASPSSGAPGSTLLEGPAVEGAELAGRWPAFFGAARGRAFFLEVVAGQIAARPLRTALPAHEVFGLNADRRLLLYRPLDSGLPSGDLVVEDLGTGSSRRLSPHLVLEAAWSPSDPRQVAYTFSSGGSFGLAVLDVDTGGVRVVRRRDVLPDSIAWPSDGGGIFYYHAVESSRIGQDELSGRTIHEEPHAVLTPRFVSVREGTDEEISLEALPPAFPALQRLRDPAELSEPVREEREPGRSRPRRLKSAELPLDLHAFRVLAPGHVREVLGDSLLGAGPLYVRELPSGESRLLGEGRLLEVLESGVVVRSVRPGGTTIEVVAWDGSSQTIASTDVSYGLPLATAYVTQGGQRYPPPGNCSIFSHTSNSSMGYAYDLWRSAGHVLASAGGLVVYAHGSVTCNSCDAAGCSDYVPGCSSNSGWGNAVIVEHADGTYTKYTHIQHGSLRVATGAAACPGLWLGTQGHTGCTSGSGCGDHLHFQRQSTAALSGPSVSIAFGETANPLSCGLTYTSANPELASCAPPGTNVAPSAAAWQASSVYSGAYGGDKAYDGVVSASSKWTSDGTAAESWLALDLGVSRNITGFVVRHAGSAGEHGYYNTVSFRLETADSFGGPWTTRATVSNPGQQATSTVTLADPVISRYVRLYVTDAGIDDYARIPELEVYATALPPTNVARSAVAWQASSVYSGEYGGNKAYDGVVSVSSKWTSNGTTAHSWLSLDLGASYELTQFVVRHAGSAGEHGYYNTVSFRLETGDSLGGPWTTRATVSNPSQQPTSTVTLAAPVGSRYVRLYVTDAGIDDYARIPELEVYGTAPLAGQATDTGPVHTTVRPRTAVTREPTFGLSYPGVSAVVSDVSVERLVAESLAVAGVK